MRSSLALGLVLLLCGCACSDTASLARGDVGRVERDDAASAAARAAATPVVAPNATAAPDAAPDALDKLTVFARAGVLADDVSPPLGPVLALDSGAPATTLFGWVQSALFSGESGRGDLVVLSAGGGDRAAQLLALAPFRSVQTLSLADNPSAADYAMAAAILSRAEAVWFEGGDQAKYVRWGGSALMAAVQGVYDRGGGVGGTSAGMIILGSAVNDALLTLSENLTTARLLADPFDADLHFTRNLLRLAPLDGSITDPHFAGQDRMGRLVTFMARQVEGPAGYRGVAVDDGAALVIANDQARRLGSGSGSVYVVHGGVPTRLAAGQPLRYAGLQVRRLTRPEHVFDLARGCGSSLNYELNVDADGVSPYSVDPYTSGTLESDCALP